MLVGIPGERTAILKQLSSDTISGERTVVDYLGQYGEGFSVRYRVLKEGYFDKAVALCKEVFLRMDRMRRLLNQSGVSSNKKKLKRHSGSFDFERDNPLRKYRHFPMSEISRNSFIGNGHQCWRFPWKNAHHRAPRRNNREVVEVEIEIEFTQPKSQQFPAGSRSSDDYMRRRAANIDTEKDRLENEHNQYNTSTPLPNTDSKTVNLNSITLSPTENYQRTGEDIKADSKTQSPQRNEAEGQVAPYRTISPTSKLSRRNVKIAATPDTPSENYRSIGGGIRQGKAQIITKNPESSEGAPGENAEEGDADDNTVTPSTSNLSRRTANITASPNITRENYQSIGQEFRKANTENNRGSPGSNEEDPGGNKEEDDTDVNTITNPTSKLFRRTGNVDSSRGTPDEDNQDTTQGTRKPNTESIAASQESVIDRSQLNDEEGGVFQDISSTNMLNRRTSTAEILSGDKQGVGRGIRKPSAVTENAGYNEEERDITDNIIAPHMHSLNRRTAKIGQGVRKPKAQSITESPGEIGEEDFIDSIITPITLKHSRWTANITSSSESLSEDNQGIEEETRTLNEKYTSENPEGKGENSDRNGEGDITGNVIVTHSLNRRTGKVSSTSETPAVANQGTEEGTRKPNTENATESPETDRTSANDEESKVDNTDSSTASKASRRSSKVPYVPQTPAEGDKLIKKGTGKPNAEKITENLGAASENPGESDEEGDIKDNIIAPNMHNLNRRNGKVSSSPETPTEGNQGREEGTRKTNTESTTKNPETASEEGDIKDNVTAPYMHNLNRRTAKVSSTPETPSEGNQGREDGTGKQNAKETTENSEAANGNPSESDEEGGIKDNIIAPN
ncbi:unnamed protein product, partial [Nippostrongylus brasiliensis]|uniref:RRM domain-containing protein n=1 Tax=Nippostrongylus brasiliensis TaxID=27835 RepID=A0A0N4XK79_NIPBR